MSSFQKIYTSCFFTLLIGVFVFFGWYQGIIECIVTLCLYSIFVYGIYRAWNYFRKKQSSNYTIFFGRFLYKVALTLSIFFLLFGSFIFVQNELNPAKMPLYTLSNGEKTLQFQTMSHIGSVKFYEHVQTNIRNAKKQNFVLFYEGVGPGSEENLVAFNQALGITFDADLYENFSKLYGVVAQDNEMFLKLENDKDSNVDLNLDEVMKLYHEKTNSGSKNTASTKAPENMSVLLKESIEHLSQNQLRALQYINQSLLNFIVKHDALRNSIMERFGNPDIFHVILEERNEHLVMEILRSSDDKIFILYGLMHFEGVFKLLKEKDPKWNIVEKSSYPLIDA